MGRPRIHNKHESPGLGKRIFEARLSRQLTQREVADACGCTKSYISQLEHERKFASEQMLALLEQALKVTLRKYWVAEVKRKWRESCPS